MKGSLRGARPGTWNLKAYDRLAEKQVRRTFKGSRRQAESELGRLVAEVEARSQS